VQIEVQKVSGGAGIVREEGCVSEGRVKLVLGWAVPCTSYPPGHNAGISSPLLSRLEWDSFTNIWSVTP
jgi:hypothetical protein